ncbi:uncharacterized protein LAESUDRAFT_723801 [Laetiporus sulphureus 93-53]|uniref:Uncharacterized protein n=1 Tax=Laetiporus sulphureus 93-53 TaxID=1314785 RepID=A0A165F3M1_9APHY|nr:uncharacterized protein LAESUDRAFT_723801 [Laetiporus sulphureus 93-53]KZT08311.1 hypothetical protein LAESUDRAFT_723801 [Laetiporus sulphureus 93-53]
MRSLQSTPQHATSLEEFAFSSCESTIPSHALESPARDVWRSTPAFPSPTRAGTLARSTRNDADRAHILWTRAVIRRTRAGPYASHVHFGVVSTDIFSMYPSESFHHIYQALVLLWHAT